MDTPRFRSASTSSIRSAEFQILFLSPDPGADEASKANGTVALLSFDKIRLYDRIAASKGMMEVEFQRYLGAMSALRSFRSAI